MPEQEPGITDKAKDVASKTLVGRTFSGAKKILSKAPAVRAARAAKPLVERMPAVRAARLAKGYAAPKLEQAGTAAADFAKQRVINDPRIQAAEYIRKNPGIAGNTLSAVKKEYDDLNAGKGAPVAQQVYDIVNPPSAREHAKLRRQVYEDATGLDKVVKHPLWEQVFPFGNPTVTQEVYNQRYGGTTNAPAKKIEAPVSLDKSSAFILGEKAANIFAAAKDKVKATKKQMDADAARKKYQKLNINVPQSAESTQLIGPFEDRNIVNMRKQRTANLQAELGLPPTGTVGRVSADPYFKYKPRKP